MLLYVNIRIFIKYYMVKFLVFLALVVGHSFVYSAKIKPAPPTLEPPSYALWNIDTGDYLGGNNETGARPMASITKLMNAYVILNDGVDLDEQVLVVGKESSSRIRAGMRLARWQLLELALISSDNLAARTLAETFPGGYSRFIQRMNDAAVELNMGSTQYQDATGLLAGNISSPLDLRKLVVAVSPYGIITSAANTAKYAFKAKLIDKKGPKEIVVGGANTNSFAGKLDIIAAKTGFTSRAGRCLTMLFNHNGNRYLLVVLGATTSEQRKKMVEQLIDKIK